MRNLEIIKKYKWHLLILAVLLTGGFYYSQKIKTKTDGETQVQTIKAVVQKGSLTENVSASGQIASANYLSVTTSVNGIVKKVFVKEGDIVASGQKLMEITLDSEGEKSRTSAYAKYLSAKSSLNEAQKSIKILENTVFQKEKTFDTEKENNSYQSRDEKIAYSSAESAYLIAKNDLENKKNKLQELQLSLTSAWLDYQSQSPIITAPSDGAVASIVAVEGAKIENSVSERSVKTVAAIKKDGTPIASLNVGEVDIPQVKVGQKVNITLNSNQEKKLKGVVSGIDKVGTNSNGVTNYPVIVKLDNDFDFILPNMNIQAEIVIKEKSDVLYVPTAAIRTVKNKSTVVVIRNGIEETIEVETGISDDSNTEVISGLNDGEEILINTLPTEGFTTTNSQNQFRAPVGIGTFGTGSSGRRN